MADRPKYPIPWIATYFLTALALIAGSFLAVWYVDRPGPGFDYDDHDMQFLERIVLADNPREGDFAGLNGGEWRALCLAGWRADLRAALDAAGIAPETGEAMRAAHASVEPEVKETEFVLVYVDGKGHARAVHHPHGFAFAQDGAAACTTNDEAVLALPVMPR